MTLGLILRRAFPILFSTVQAQNRVEKNELELPTEVELRGPTEEEARFARARRTVLALPAAALTEEEEEEERVQREVEEMLREQGVCISCV